MELMKLQPKLHACNATQNCTKIQPGRRLAPFPFYTNLYLTRTLSKRRAETRSRYGTTDFFWSFSPVSLS